MDFISFLCILLLQWIIYYEIWYISHIKLKDGKIQFLYFSPLKIHLLCKIDINQLSISVYQ